MADYTYTAYGLSIRSSEPVPGLPESHSGRAPEVELVWGELPERVEDGSRRERVFPLGDQSDHESPALVAWRIPPYGHVWFKYADGTQFVVDAAGTKVWSSWPPTLTLQDAAPSLLGPILGFLLRVRGVLCLHAAGVASGQNGFALVGPQGAGKSTLAAAFAEAGYAVLADDVLSVVESAGGFHIQPGYPRLRLWDESVSALYGHSDALPLLAPHWDKRYLDLTGPRHRFHAVSVPLRAIYVLEARSVSPAAPLVEPVSHGAAFMSLVRNTYANQLLDDSMRRTEFSQLESLVAAVPVRRVRPHNDYAQLASLRIAICEDLERIIGDAQGGGS